MSAELLSGPLSQRRREAPNSPRVGPASFVEGLPSSLLTAAQHREPNGRAFTRTPKEGCTLRASRGYLDLGVRKNRSPETHSTETMASGRAIRSCGGAKARSASGACRPLPAAEQGSRDGTDSSHSTAAAATSLHATGKGSPRRTLSYTRLIRPRTIASASPCRWHEERWLLPRLSGCYRFRHGTLARPQATGDRRR